MKQRPKGNAAVDLPIRTVSEPNMRDGRWKKSARAKEQRELARMACNVPLSPARTATGIAIYLIRFGKGKLDGDNLQGALKAVRDGVADALGMKDNDPRISWLYGQERAETYSVRIAAGWYVDNPRARRAP